MSRIPACAAVLLTAIYAAFLCLPSTAQEPYPFENDLVAKGRAFKSVGAGFRAVRRGPNKSYYILTAPAPVVQIFDATGRRFGQIPSDSSAKNAGLVYGESLDVDGQGRVAVADRGADSVKVYNADGALSASIHVPAPESVLLLSDGDVAVASPNALHLVTVYNINGDVVSEFGDREEIADRADVNNQVNFGHLEADQTGNAYFAFDYLPEPTVRKFDRGGYLSLEILLNSLDFQPAAQAARKALARSETGTPALHRIISAMGVDPQNEEVWLAIGTLLMHFDKDGQRIASFRIYLRDDARFEPAMILVEPDRLLMGADPQGIYEFPKPPRLPQ